MSSLIHQCHPSFEDSWTCWSWTLALAHFSVSTCPDEGVLLCGDEEGNRRCQTHPVTVASTVRSPAGPCADPRVAPALGARPDRDQGHGCTVVASLTFTASLLWWPPTSWPSGRTGAPSRHTCLYCKVPVKQLIQLIMGIFLSVNIFFISEYFY